MTPIFQLVGVVLSDDDSEIGEIERKKEGKRDLRLDLLQWNCAIHPSPKAQKSPKQPSLAVHQQALFEELDGFVCIEYCFGKTTLCQ